MLLGEAERQVIEFHTYAIVLVNLQTAKWIVLRPCCSVGVGVGHSDIVVNDRPPLHVLKLKLELGEGRAG